MYQIKIVVLLLVMLIGVSPKICFADLKPAYLISGFKWNDFRTHFGSNNRSDLSTGLAFDLNVEKTSRVELLKTNFQARSSDNRSYRIAMIDLNYISVRKQANYNVFSTVGISDLKLESESRNLFNFGVGVSRRLSDKLKWRAEIKKFFPSDNLTSFSNLQIGLSLAYQLGKSRVKKDAPRYAATERAKIKSNRHNNDRELSLDSRCSNSQTESWYSSGGGSGLAQGLEQSDFVFYFDFDQIKMNRKDRAKMERIVLMLEQHEELSIVLQGHADAIGTKKYNQSLSEKRAIQVRNVMIREYRAPPDRILTAGFGECHPVEDNTFGHGRAKNRRVVTVGFETERPAEF